MTTDSSGTNRTRARDPRPFDTDDDQDPRDELRRQMEEALQDFRETATETMRMLEASYWKANIEMLSGLLAVARYRASRAQERSHPVERIEVE